MKNICLFNHFHNGDIFYGKEFVRQISETIDNKVFYFHSNNLELLADVNVTCKNISDLPIEVGERTKFFETENCYYVNIWIGSYFHQGIKYSQDSIDSECTLRFLYTMFSLIYEELNKTFGCDLKLKSIDNYFPIIDYSKFNISNINEYININKGKRVLFSNGPCMSGQCSYDGDMSPIIKTLAEKYSEITFIVTKQIECDLKNIVSTNDIIKVDGCDLNEIGYLSKFCDVVVGRNSGPFCFCTNRDNMNNSNITFYAFGNNVYTSFFYGIELECQFIFEFFNNLESTTKTIDSLIAKL